MPQIPLRGDDWAGFVLDTVEVSLSAGSAGPDVATVGVPLSGRETVVVCRGVTRVWGHGRSAQTAVDDVDIEIGRGEFLAIVGRSGSGKSTLGGLVAGLDRPTAGAVVVGGVHLDELSDDALAKWRASEVGVVFQNFHLISTLTALENVLLGLRFGPRGRGHVERARSSLADFGLADKADRFPAELSGGEQQRVGIARAVVHQPSLLIADEPTGSLDRATSERIVELLQGRVADGLTMVLITHETAIAEAADRVLTMVDGRIVGVAS